MQDTQNQPLSVTMPVRRLVEFLLRSGSIDERFTDFDRANEGARIHRKLQKEALKAHPDYQAELALRQIYNQDSVCYTIEGRADGFYTPETTATPTVEEIKTTAAPLDAITEDFAPEHWAQGMVYAAILSLQQELPKVDVQLTYYQIDEEQIVHFGRSFTAAQLTEFVADLLHRYAPWAHRAARWQQDSRKSFASLGFPFGEYRKGQRAMAGEVYRTCIAGGSLLCQAPTGIGKTISVLFPAIKAMADDGAVRKDGSTPAAGPTFYLTARTTTRTAAEHALAVLRRSDPNLLLRSITLTAKDKICLQTQRECTPDACPYAKDYYEKSRDALWAGLDRHALDVETLQQLGREFSVCPFELGLDLSLWCDVIIGDYNYLFDPVVRLRRFFDGRGDYLFLVDEAHNLPERARSMHSASLCKSDFYNAKKLLGKGRSRLGNQLKKVNDCFIRWRHACEEAPGGRRTLFTKDCDEDFNLQLTRLCTPLKEWLEEHRTPDETHAAILQLFFDVRSWLRVADTFDEHFVLQLSAGGSEVYIKQICLDPSAFLASDFEAGRAAILFSATLSPPGYYKDLCGLPEAKAVALQSPFPQSNLGLWCLAGVSTRYKDRESSLDSVTQALAAMVSARQGNYIAFFPSYSYLEKVYERFQVLQPACPTLKQETAMDEAARTDFLAAFQPESNRTMLGFAVLGGVFGEGIDLAGDRLIGVAVVGPGLPQVNPRTEQLRSYFEETRGSGFDYAYRYPGMNKVLQAAGRVIRTPEDKGVLLLIDERFAHSEYCRLMPPHWSHLSAVYNPALLPQALQAFWADAQSKHDDSPASKAPQST